MKSLIIHPKDSSTDFLSIIYADMEDYTLVTGTKTMNEMKDLIKAHDRVIMLGHGSEDGLYDFQFYGFIVDESLVDVLREKPESVYIWCNADIFVKKHGLKGFYTGMIISELIEAQMHSVTPNDGDLAESNQKFSISVKEGINKTPELMVETVKEMYSNEDNHIMSFNRANIYHV